MLLEGSPGVGKTSLISALAEATGHEVWICARFHCTLNSRPVPLPTLRLSCLELNPIGIIFRRLLSFPCWWWLVVVAVVVVVVGA